ncbi:MAG: sulfotransferase [Gammaproteobacteria bacterium]
MNDSQFFIIGNPRSGTTIFRLMLHAHPEICVPPECGFALWLYNEHRNWCRRDGSLDAVIQDILASRKMDTWEIDAVQLIAFVKQHKPDNYQEICNLVYRFYGQSIGKKIKIWGDKNNFYIDYIPTMKALFPACKLILITRDGRDVACSYRELNRKKITSDYAPVLPDTIDDIAREWSDNNNKALSFFNNINQDDVFIVRYEDLILNTRATLAGVTNFLGLDFSTNMLDYHKDESEPIEFLQWKHKVRERLDSSHIGRYKQFLSQADVRNFENIAGSMLQKLHYPLNDLK